LEQKASSTDPLYFAIIDKADNKAKGYITLMRIDVPNRVIVVGNVVYGASMRRTAMATEAQFLLMRYVFDDLHFRKYEWKCNSLNSPSRRAAERYGFHYEGLFRQHMIVKVCNRDTAWYSMTDFEWPAIEIAFENLLSPQNFCPTTGKQINSLQSFRL
jgi:RimJ/RimL family protein N-acetyltransferase